MAFGIGSFLKSIVGTVAPIIGGVFGGPVGAAIGGAVGQAFGRSSTGAAAPARSSQVGPTAFNVQRRRVGTIGGFAVGTAVSLITDLLRGSRERTGQAVNVRKVIEAVRVCGIEQAAQIFDLTENEICRIVISKRRRRARGISAADLRRTRSTIRKVHNISHDLRALAPPARAHRRAHR